MNERLHITLVDEGSINTDEKVQEGNPGNR